MDKLVMVTLNRMFRGPATVLEDLKNHYPLNDAAETTDVVARSVSRVMGGTSAILYKLFLFPCVQLFYSPRIDAFQAALAAPGKYGGASADYRIVLDALIPAATVLEETAFRCRGEPSRCFCLLI